MRSYAILCVRVILGLIFGMAGYYKCFIMTPAGHAQRLFLEPYATTWIPTWLLWATGVTIPVIEHRGASRAHHVEQDAGARSEDAELRDRIRNGWKRIPRPSFRSLASSSLAIACARRTRSAATPEQTWVCASSNPDVPVIHDAEKRAALDLWGRELQRILRKKGKASVIAFKPKPAARQATA